MWPNRHLHSKLLFAYANKAYLPKAEPEEQLLQENIALQEISLFLKVREMGPRKITAIELFCY